MNRTISMSNKYFGGVVENRNVQLTENDAAVDADLKQTVTGTYAKVVAKMEELRVADALTEIFGIFKRCNKYIDETEPWYWPRTKPRQIVWLPFCTIWWKVLSLAHPC